MRGTQINALLAAKGFVYEQRTGNFYFSDNKDVRALIGVGYSGAGVGYNAPDLDDRIAEGPIPRGVWRIRDAIRHDRLGPICLGLEPAQAAQAKGRSGFFIHGDNSRRDGTASSGCIILPRECRAFIQGSGVRTLTVVSG